MRYMSGGKLKVPLVMRAPVGATAAARSTPRAWKPSSATCPASRSWRPATAYDAKGLLKSAVRDDNPVLVFEHKLLYGCKGPRTETGALSPVGEVPDEDYMVPIGKGIVRREGKDVTIVGKLLMMYRALAAAEVLAKEGIEAEVIDPRTLVPLDKELILESVRKTGRLVIVEEDNLTGGWAGESRPSAPRGLLLAGRADQARLRARHPAALRAGHGAVLRAERRARGRGGESSDADRLIELTA